MFKKILFPVFGEIIDDSCIDIASDIASKYNGEIFLLTVSEIYHTGIADLNLMETLLEQHKNLLKDYIKNYSEKFNQRGIPNSSSIREGIAYREILDYAEEIKAGLIIIPSHGRVGLPGFIMGSVSQKVIKLAKCPVLVFKPKFKEEFKNE